MLQTPPVVEGPGSAQGPRQASGQPASLACLNVSRRASFWRELRPRSTAIDSTVLARAVLQTSSKRAPETSPGAAALGVLQQTVAHFSWCMFCLVVCGGTAVKLHASDLTSPGAAALGVLQQTAAHFFLVHVLLGCVGMNCSQAPCE